MIGWFLVGPSREWRTGFLGLLSGTLRHYYRDPFPHSLLRTRELILYTHRLLSSSFLGLPYRILNKTYLGAYG